MSLRRLTAKTAPLLKSVMLYLSLVKILLSFVLNSLSYMHITIPKDKGCTFFMEKLIYLSYLEVQNNLLRPEKCALHLDVFIFDTHLKKRIFRQTNLCSS